jgi:hypothetical protein
VLVLGLAESLLELHGGVGHLVELAGELGVQVAPPAPEQLDHEAMLRPTNRLADASSGDRRSARTPT